MSELSDSPTGEQVRTQANALQKARTCNRSNSSNSSSSSGSNGASSFWKYCNKMADRTKVLRLCVALTLAIQHVYFLAKRSRSNQVLIIKRQIIINSDGRYSPILASSSYPTKIPSEGNKSANQHDPVSSKERAKANTTSERSKFGYERLPKIDKYLSYYYTFSFIFNLYLIIKNVIITALRFEALKEYRFLDCYLVGRFMLTLRVMDMAGQFVCFLAFYHILWMFLMKKQPSNLRLQFAEFLLCEVDEVSHCESNSSNQQVVNATTIPEQNIHYSSLFYYHNPLNIQHKYGKLAFDRGPLNTRFAQNGHRVGSCRLGNDYDYQFRPNRTIECWNSLSKLCIRITVITFLSLFGLLVFFFSASTPFYIANRGFELTHEYCIGWMVEQSKHNNDTKPSMNLLIDYKKMLPHKDLVSYRKPEPYLKLFIPINGDYVEFNYYHAVRILVSLFENFIIYVEIYFAFAYKLIMILLISHDVSSYCDHISQKLEQLIEHRRFIAKSRQVNQENIMQNVVIAKEKFRYQSQLRTNPSNTLPITSLHAIFGDHTKTKSYIYDIQASIIDLFNLIDNYNRHTSIQMSYLLALWLTYSAIVSGWIFLPLEDSPKLEWYILHGFATIYMILLIGPLASVRAKCLKIHKLITSTMALDIDDSNTKSTWLMLLRFYNPVPLYCFTILTNVEMSKMLSLKLVAWIFSALFVISSFFNTYNMRQS